MKTLDIGDEITREKLPAIHVVSTALGIESRVESFGLNDGCIFHARSFNKSRRLVLVAGLVHGSVCAVLDALDHLPDLPAAEVGDALSEVVGRLSRARQTVKPVVNYRAIRIQANRADWVGSATGYLLWHRAKSLLRRSRLKSLPLTIGEDGLARGVVQLGHGDELLSWVGVGLAEIDVVGLFSERVVQRVESLSSSSARGCLGMLRRI